MGNSDIEVVVVGSNGLDTVETRTETRKEQLGGSVSYACAAASYYTPTGMVGVVGSDFPAEHTELYESFHIDLAGLERVDGATFRWAGKYDEDMINRDTLLTELGVFADFMPVLPDAYRAAPFLLLGNIAPVLQLHVLDQIENPEFVMVDTMDLWINIAREDLIKVIGRTDLLMLNDSEARLLTNRYNLRDCAEVLMEMGPAYVVIKKGEHGAMLFSPDGIFLVPAYPVASVVDPTGAGDTFAGAFIGHIAQHASTADSVIREGLLHGAVVASLNVEAFSLDRLCSSTSETIEARLAELKAMMRV
jgi:sugar/nucleoside kinase (ribokinase family)